MMFRSVKKKRRLKQVSKVRRFRRLLTELLEERDLLSADWQNPARPNDVNNDMKVSAIDALIVINDLNSNGVRTLEDRTNRLDQYLDTSGDGRVSPTDALRVINQINHEGDNGIVIAPRIEGAVEPAPAGFISTFLVQLPRDRSEAYELASQISIVREEFNEMGLFFFDGPGGNIEGVDPSSNEYPDAVFGQAERKVLYSRRDIPRDSRDVVVPAGSSVGLYVLQGYSADGTPEAHIQINQQDAFSFQVGWQRQAANTSGAGSPFYDDVLVDIQIRESDTNPPELSVRLNNDTGNDQSDGVTSDPQIAIGVSDDVGLQSLRVGFGDTAVDEYVEIISSVDEQGQVVLSRTELASILGESLVDGTYTMRAIAADATGNTKASDVVFTLDTAAPAPPTATLSATSRANREETTASARVSLVGQADPNVFVSIAGSNVRGLASNTGGYQIPGVELELGENLLHILAEDAAGNTSSQTELTIHRLESSTSDDPVLTWNRTVLEAIRLDASTPPFASRAMGMVHAAILDAVNAVEGKPGFFVALNAEPLVAAEAAVAAAGHGVLTHLYPAFSNLFDSTLENALAGIEDGPEKENGIALGEQAASSIIQMRSDDGWNNFVDYIPGSGLGEWRPTIPTFDVGLLPQWAGLTPFTLSDPSQFRPDGPPELNSAAYAVAWEEVKELGSANSATRTVDQSEIAQFWVDGLGTYTPPGHWNQIAGRVATAEGNSLAENARLFAQLNLALADAGIAAWDAKYFFDFWRPVTAIQNADVDGNSSTTSESTWTPFMTTPPFPEYVSGHSTFSGAAVAVLTANFGENYAFETTSIGMPGVTRSFNSFTEAGEEAGRSRVFGGIHYEFSNQDGLETGRAVARHVMDAFTVQSDFLAPTLMLDTPDELVVSGNVSITGAVLDTVSGVQSVEVSLNGEAFSTVAFDERGRFEFRTAFVLDGSDDGPHVFRVRANDFAGNVTEGHVITVDLDTAAPQLIIDSPSASAVVSAGDRLTGTIDGTGSALRSLRYAIDDGDPIPLPTDGGNAFDVLIDVWALSPGPHELVVTGIDSAGNLVSESRSFHIDVQPELMISAINPGNGAVEVGTTFRPQVFFSRSIDPATINENNFFATGPSGERIAAQIVPANDGRFAWLFFDDPLPGGSTITLQVGNEDIAETIRTPEGGTLDADQNGEQGGVSRWQFTTVSLTPLPGTTLTGIVADPGPDRKPGTLDDVQSGADGVLGTADDVYLRPIAGAHVYVIGLEEYDVMTDENGRFTLDAVPAGNVKLVIDGMTATDAPSGVYFPEMVMDLNILGGRTNTVMAAMEPVPARRAQTEMHGVYLPRIETSILETVMADESKTIRVDAASAPNLTAQQRAMLTLEIQPNSLVAPDGSMLDSGEIGISTVPPELVRDMLPPGLLQHTFDITIQAPGISNFSTPMPMTFPNTMGAAPGTKLDFLSFDHTTGRLVIEGTATVSEDGLSVHTDPGTGITHPGWHGLTPPGGCGGTGGPPPPPPPPPEPEDTVNEPEEPVVVDMHFGDAGFVGGFLDLFKIEWELEEENDNQTPPPPDGCRVSRRPEEEERYLSVEIDIDGPLADFARQSGDVPLHDNKFIVTEGYGEKRTLSFKAKSYEEMFGAGGLKNVDRDQLYGSIIRVTEIRGDSDGSRTYDYKTYVFSRWVTAVDAEKAVNGSGRTAAFLRTNTEGVIRSKTFDTFLPDSVTTSFLGTTNEFGFNSPSGDTTTWRFDPSVEGKREAPATIQWRFDVESTTFTKDLGTIQAHGTATNPTTIGINTEGFIAELRRVILRLNEDPQTGSIFYADNYTSPVLPNFQMEFSGFMPGDRLDPGPDMQLGTADDEFTPDQLASLDAKLNDQAENLVAAVQADFTSIPGIRVESGAGDVNVAWVDEAQRTFLGLPATDQIFGYADGDRNLSYLEDLIATNVGISDNAKVWSLAEGLNLSVDNDATIGIAKHMDWRNSEVSFSQFISNTVVHELGHTFGLLDAYLRVETNEGARGSSRPPHDIMSGGHPRDGNLTFAPSSIYLLQAAMGMQSDDTSVIALDALSNFQDGFFLPRSDRSLRETAIATPALRLLREGRYFDSQDSDFLGVIASDEDPDTKSTFSYEIVNVGLEPLTIHEVRFGESTPDFELDAEGIAGTTVPPGDSIPFQISGNPVQERQLMGAIRIRSNSDFSSEFELEISGRAVNSRSRLMVDSGSLPVLGGLSLNSADSSRRDSVTIQNTGLQPLQIIDIRIINGGAAFQLTDLPGDWSASPITLEYGEQFSFDAEFLPSELGLQHAVVEITSNDPVNPIQRLTLVGTGLDEVVYPEWGNDFVAIEFPELPGDRVLRTVSDPSGDFEFFLPPSTPYHLTIFDPVTGLVSHGYGTTPVSGAGIDLTATLVFDASISSDSDFDGLPDDIEHAIGTASNAIDTDGDGLTDFAEIEQGLDPLTGFNVQTGVIASLMLPGESRQVVVAGDNESPSTQHAFVATGSHGLAIVNVSQFDNPILLGQLDLDGEATDVAVDSRQNLAAVATNAGGIQIVNVADPMRPVLSRVIPGDFSRVEVVDETAYASDVNTLFAFDLRSGETLASIPLAEDITDIAWDGKMLHTMGINKTLTVIDASKGQLQPRGSTTLPNGGGLISSAGGTVYAIAAANPLGGFATADVTDPDNPTVISGSDAEMQSLPKTAIVPNGSGIGLLIGQTERVEGEPSFLTVMDIADPENTSSFVTSIDLEIPPTSISIASGIAFVTDAAGLQVINYLAFDNRGEPPNVDIIINADSIDIDPIKPGIQVFEGALVPVGTDVRDDLQVRDTELLLNGIVVHDAVSFPFNLNAIAPTLTDGESVAEFQLQVRASDTGGNTGVSSPIAIQVLQDVAPPVVDRFDIALLDVDAETPGIQLLESSDLLIRFEASDLGGLQTVELVNNGFVAQSIAKNVGVFLFRIPALGDNEDSRTIELQLVAKDRAENSVRTDAVSFDVVRDTKSPSITSINLNNDATTPLGPFTLNIVLDEPIDPSKINGSVFQLVGPSGTSVPAEAITILNDDHNIRVRYDLESVGSYSLSIDATAIADRVGNQLSDGLLIYEFRTSTNATPLFLLPKYEVPKEFGPAVAVDFDQNGTIDLVGALGVLIGDGSGAFPSFIAFDESDQTSAVVSADFNGDGLPDLATANLYNDDISVRLQLPLGGVSTPMRISTGDYPIALVSEDFDGDGVVDLAVANAGTGAGVQIFRGSGDGTFSALPHFGGNTSARAMAAADMDGDSISDLVVANEYTDYVSIFLGNGDGSFADEFRRPTGNNPSGIIINDFNRDGFNDFATANSYSDDVWVSLGEADLTFSRQLQFGVGDQPRSLSMGDYNGDGITDLATPNISADDVSILLGNGDGSFQPERRFDTYASPISLPTADFNADGISDLAVQVGYASTENDGSIHILLGDAEVLFRSPPRYPVRTASNLTTADFNGDGVLDIATDEAVLLGKEGGGFEDANFISGSTRSSMTTGDLNGDGVVDLLAVPFSSQRVLVYLGVGDGTFSGQQLTMLGVKPSHVVVGDLDNDGVLDLVTTNGRSDDVSVLLGVGDGTFLPETRFGVGDEPTSVAIADFNGDGLPDIVSGNVRSDNVSVLLGIGDGQFASQVTMNVGDTPRTIAVADFDSDGVADIVTGNAISGDVSVLFGVGDGTFAFEERYVVTGYPVSIALGDFDDDQLLDIAVTTQFGVSILLGARSGRAFGNLARYSGIGSLYSLVAGDFDGDGKLDLAAGRYSTDEVVVLFNQH